MLFFLILMLPIDHVFPYINTIYISSIFIHPSRQYGGIFSNSIIDNISGSGGYGCTACEAGLTGDGTTCTDVDEVNYDIN
jgi:hypothetical protein